MRKCFRSILASTKPKKNFSYFLHPKNAGKAKDRFSLTILSLNIAGQNGGAERTKTLIAAVLGACVLDRALKNSWSGGKNEECKVKIE